MNEWMNERVNEWMNEWMNERINLNCITVESKCWDHKSFILKKM